MDMLNSLLGRDHAATPWTRIVVIGAGDGRRSTGWSSLPARHRDLVEADSQRAALLTRATGVAGSTTRVWTEAIAPRSGPAVWHRYNLDSLAGVCDADALREVYPRLARLESRDVEGVALADFLGRLGLDAADQADQLLILDIPGASDVLESACGHSVLHAFSSLLVRDGLARLDGPGDLSIDLELARGGYRLHGAEEGWRAYRLDPPASSSRRSCLGPSAASRCLSSNWPTDASRRPGSRPRLPRRCRP
jgi:hypothetical protein